jgi:8-oxo-dGTP diphosphatase
MPVTNYEESGLAAFTMILLRNRDRFLLLRRSPHKQFAPGRWTGIGGRVEPHELQTLDAAALREIKEETGITPGRIRLLVLRRALMQQRPGHPLTVLLYYTGNVTGPEVVESPEGELHWLAREDLEDLDIIENTAAVIQCLIDDIESDPEGKRPITVGAASFDASGALLGIRWSTAF